MYVYFYQHYTLIIEPELKLTPDILAKATLLPVLFLTEYIKSNLKYFSKYLYVTLYSLWILRPISQKGA